MKRIISIALIALMVAALLTACGGPDGKYVVKSIGGKAVDEVVKEQAEALGESADELLKQMNIDKAEELMVLELKSDGTAAMESGLTSSSMSGTWKQDGDKISITMKGALGEEETSVFTLEGNELSNDEGEQKYVFVKK